MNVSRFILRNSSKFSAGAIIAMIVGVTILGVLVVTIPPVEGAKFVLAEWDYPDEYGQGIELFAFYENSTGSWLPAGDAYEHDQSYTIEWNGSVAIKLRCYTFFNSTLTGAIDEPDGQNYQRHNVTVTSVGQTVFSQNNFTYYNVNTALDPLWYYGYEVVLNFIPAAGEIYTVMVTYEIYW